MNTHTHKMINGTSVPLTPEEASELTARDEAYVPPKTPLSEPTKEELLSQINALAAQIQTLA